MMRIVFDANILMAVLIGGRSFHKTLFSTFDVIVPDFALVEIDKYSGLIVDKTKMDWQQHKRYAESIFSGLTIIPRYLIEHESIKRAIGLIGETDTKDVPYVALALQMDTILVTRDKPIVEAARRRGFRRIILYEEFLKQYA